ncbi:MAG: polyphosphate polymerase domain-containing protein [Lachnospiraceae bacterium]
MANNIFERVEKKYLLTKEQFNRIKEEIEYYMILDEFGLHTIHNLYCDTNQYELISKSLEKPIYKEKLRLRMYENDRENSKVFLELKKKFRGVVFKRRINLSLEESFNFVEHGVKPDIEHQIINEIQYFLNHYNAKFKVYIGYDRLAYYNKFDEALRITFDQNIRSTFQNLNFDHLDDCEMLLSNGECLMEIKCLGAYPTWLIDILSLYNIYPTSFSKYGKIYIDYMTNPRKYSSKKLVKKERLVC